MGEISLWKEEYRIGNEVIDAQHKELFDKIESLLHISTTGDVEASRKECLDIIDFLVSYTMFHFESEEAYQKEIGYVSYIEHVKLHEQFRNTVLMYKEKMEKEFSQETLKKFGGTMMTWLTIHVCGCDRKIVNNEFLGANITFENADDLIHEVTVQFLADTCGIAINSTKTSVYNGDIEGKVIVRIIISGKNNHVFLFGFSEEMTRTLYHKISGMEINSIDSLNEIEESAMIELGDILSSHTIAYINKAGRTHFDWKGDIFMDEYSDTDVDISNSVMLSFNTECGTLEVMYCLMD